MKKRLSLLLALCLFVSMATPMATAAGTITVTYDKNAGTYLDGRPLTDNGVSTTAPYTIKDAYNAGVTRPGYELRGWNSEADWSGDTYEIGQEYIITKDIVLYAMWALLPTGIHTLVYNGTSGTFPNGNHYISTDHPYGTVLTVQSAAQLGLTSPGYTFLGWFSKLNGQGTKYEPGTEITLEGDLILYASWGTTSAYAAVIYHPNNGSGDPPHAVTGIPINSEYEFEASPFTYAGHSFDAWNTAQDGSGTTYNVGDKLVISQTPFEVYAQWKVDGGGPSDDEVTLSYHANGATSGTAPAGGSYVPGTQVPVAGRGSLMRAEHSFTTWNTAADGSGTSYAENASITLNANTTLYAQWLYVGGTTPPPTKEVEIDDDDTPRGTLDMGKHTVYLFGYPDRTVRPDNDITRSEAASIFFRLLDPTVHSDKLDPVANQFSDVSGNAWYAQAVNYLASIKVILGLPDGTFAPEAKITRAEFATIASRFDNLTRTDENIFSDVPTTHWAVRYINSAAKKGWVSGYSDSTFRPERAITRGEVVSLVNTMLNREIDSDALAKNANPYVDISTGHWAYKDVLEASLAHEYLRDANGKETWVASTP